MDNKRKKREKGIEEILSELREKKGWTRWELVERLENDKITEKDIKKWEVGLKYPDLDIIYKLSEIYEVSSTELIQAKNNSYQYGVSTIDIIIVKWICYILNVSLYTGTVIVILFYIFAIVFAFVFLARMAEEFIKVRRAV